MGRILMVASEAAPFVKTGGLADVIGALPAALRARGEEVAVVLPLYGQTSVPGAHRLWANHPIWLGGACYTVDIHMATRGDVPFYFVDCPPLFDRHGIYVDASGKDYPDNHIRFAVFCRAALALVRHSFRPNIIHCHDWQAALVPIYLHALFPMDPTFLGIKTLFTIHNLGYQGLFPQSTLPEMGLDGDLFHMDGLEFFGRVNVLKGGVIFSDAVSTVSKGYAREIQTEEFGFGLGGLFRARKDSLYGIVNGVDYREWNPETDPHLAARYSSSGLSGKQACKLDLLREFGLPPEAAERPVAGIVSRFFNQKGFDLFEQVAGELIAEDLTLVALGTGEPKYETFFRDLAAAHPEKVGVRIAYDDALAHKIEAGSDLFLMPSWYEPCGLNQIYSLRYGTVPVVRATGGLDDTIDEGTGFKFREYTGRALLEAVRTALAAYRTPERWKSLMLNGMKKDFSWSASAAEYSALYKRLAG